MNVIKYLNNFLKNIVQNCTYLHGLKKSTFITYFRKFLIKTFSRILGFVTILKLIESFTVISNNYEDSTETSCMA